MPTSDADIRNAVAILRGLKSRVERLEERARVEAAVNILRPVNEVASGDETASIVENDASASEVASGDESVAVSEESAAGMTWDTSNWGFTEWG